MEDKLLSQGFGSLRVAVIGAGREGSAVARFLAAQGAQVTLSDIKPAAALADSVAGLEDGGVRLVLGEQPLSLLKDIDLLLVSPGVPPSVPIVQEARKQGIAISSEPRLFAQLFPGVLVGVTGSSGKSTTTSLLGAMYQTDGRETWVGGNIGTPLIERLLEPEMAEVAVMELSSFQLEFFAPDYQGETVETSRSRVSRLVSLEGWSPPISLVTNITPNHLDRHPTMADYVAAKRQILAHQDAESWAVLNADDEISRDLTEGVRGRLLRFSLEGTVSQGAYLEDGRLLLRKDDRQALICASEEVPLRGRHNLANVLAATCAAVAGGVSLEAIRKAVKGFEGLPHRLEAVRRWRGVSFVNDSIATSPERAVAALRAYDEPIVLLAGGRDKHLPWDEWRSCVLAQARVVVGFGDLVPIVQHELADAGHELTVVCVDSLPDAVERAAELASAGDVVLLSPGGTSYDAYADFEARGEHFRQLVSSL